VSLTCRHDHIFIILLKIDESFRISKSRSFESRIPNHPFHFRFNLLYREEVHDYLTRFGYWRNPLTGGDLQEANWTKCSQQTLFYTEIDGENEDGEEDINGRREGEGLLGQLEGKER